MPDTKPDLSFNEKGVCDACTSAVLKKKINWKDREKEFVKLVKAYSSQGKEYDCIVPVSGGKDSHYQVYMAKKYGLTPLCVHFEPSVPTELGKKNLINLRNTFGVDVISWLKNPVIYRKLCIEGFRRVGDPEWPNHLGIFTIPVKIAAKFNIPLIIWGENTQLEYGGPERGRNLGRLFDKRYLFEFGGLLGNRIEDMASKEIPMEELRGFFYPSEKELREASIAGIFLGSYFFWDAREQTDLMKKYGFSTKGSPVEGTYTDYENLDCESPAIHDYLKYTKYGFGRACDHACLDIRLGRISRQEGVELVRKYDGKFPRYGTQKMMEYLGMNEKEFVSIIDSFTNKKIFKTDKKGRLVKMIDGTLVKRDECVLT